MGPELLESEIQAAILSFLRAIPGVMAKKMDVGFIPGRTSAIKGIPDILCIIRKPDGYGDVWFIEVKRPGQKLRPEQEEFMHGWKNCGGNCIVARSVEEVIAQIPSLPQRDLFVKS